MFLVQVKDKTRKIFFLGCRKFQFVLPQNRSFSGFGGFLKIQVLLPAPDLLACGYIRYHIHLLTFLEHFAKLVHLGAV